MMPADIVWAAGLLAKKDRCPKREILPDNVLYRVEHDRVMCQLIKAFVGQVYVVAFVRVCHFRMIVFSLLKPLEIKAGFIFADNIDR